MFSVLTYGRCIARALTNSISQGDFEHLPIVSSLSQRQLCGSSSTRTSAQPNYPCKLVSAVSGFSKFDSPFQRHSRASPGAQPVFTLVEKSMYGDDAYFITYEKATDVLGVADGVGGWRTHGVDPSKFSYKLMDTCKTLVKRGRFIPGQPDDLLATGYKELKEDKEQVIGSSTACIVMLDRSRQTLHTANLGDSGFMVVRKGTVVHRSNDQTHFFNTPFQLSIVPEDQQGHVLHDAAEDADTTTFNLEIGDIILTATDGLFDNMPEDSILDKLARLKDNKLESIKEMAWTIAEEARDLSYDPDYMSPFAKQARVNGYHVRGGKPDDITILLAMVAGD